MRHLLSLAFLLFGFTGSYRAADGVWIPISGSSSGFNGDPQAMTTWNGQLIVAGTFTAIGAVPTRGLAVWDGTTWSALSGAPGRQLPNQLGQIAAVAAMGDDVVVARHLFPSEDPEPIWRYDGTEWNSIPGCPGIGQVREIAVYDGKLYVSRAAQTDGGPVLHVWDGMMWSSEPISGGIGYLVASSSNLYVTGSNLILDGVIASSPVLRLAGTAWSEVADAPGWIIAIDEDDTLWCAGSDVLGSLTSGTWTIVPSPTDQPRALHCLSGGVWLGGILSSTRPAFGGIARYDTALQTWSSPGSANGAVTGLHSHGDLLVATGSFTSAGEVAANHLAAIRDSTWETLVPSGTSGTISCCVWRDGQLYVGGSFTSVGGVRCQNLARWDGSTWHDVAVAGRVDALGVDNQGNLWAAGGISTIDGVPVTNVAYLDDSGWHAAGNLFGDFRRIIADGPDVVVCGATQLDAEGSGLAIAARWNGSAWASIGASQEYGGAQGICRTRAGSLVAVGNFTFGPADGDAKVVASWNGSQWSQLGIGLSEGPNGEPRDVMELPGGVMQVVGNMLVDGETAHQARFSGLNWEISGDEPDLMRLLRIESVVYALRWGGITVYAHRISGAGGHEWKAVASDVGATGIDAANDGRRLAVVGLDGTIDGRGCVGVAILDLAPPSAPVVSITPGSDGDFTVSMPAGDYEIRAVGGEWVAYDDTTSVVLDGEAAAASRAGVTAGPAAGWEIQRIDSPTLFSAKLAISADGKVVSGGPATTDQSASRCGAGGFGGLAVAVLLLTGLRRRRHLF